MNILLQLIYAQVFVYMLSSIPFTVWL